jgi:S1-C subfamily serine protease
MTPGSTNSANPLNRIGAAILDLIILCAATLLFGRLGLGLWAFPSVWLVWMEVGYRLHGSIGKAFFGLAVESNGRGGFYLRETIAKLASIATFGIGFLMIFGADHLALHDLIAKTQVVQAPTTNNLQIVWVVSLSIVVGFAGYVGARWGSKGLARPATAPRRATALEVITKQIPAVLTVYIYDQRGQPIAQGSGFLLNSDGLGATNFHVLREARSAEAKLGDGRLYQILRVEAYDAGQDVAIFRIGRRMGEEIEWPKDLPHIVVGSSADISIGDHIATVSSPEGLQGTVTDGLVSAIRADSGQNFLQITAPISPGSSGGPVFDLQGRVVAIAEAQFTEGQNLNFAIPIESLADIQQEHYDLTLGQFHTQVVSTQTRGSEGSNAISQEPGTLASKSSSHRAPLVTGIYAGAARNITAGLSADLFVIFLQKGDHLYGCMGVKEPLYGSGPLEGQIQGSDISFEVKSPAFVIEFSGKRVGGDVDGTYLVAPSTGGAQQGEFHLGKDSSKRMEEVLDPRSCPTDSEMNKK